jgi:phosphatidylethanolamine/phosphatidyl-N-methylethanolamine N-methyltransferase
VLKPSGRLVAPTFCHDETPLSWVVSRAIAVTGFPNKRRFSAKSLRESLETEGLSVNRAESLHGLIPIGYVDGVFGG